MRSGHLTPHFPLLYAWKGPSRHCGGACVVRDVRHDGDRCMRGARRGRACERGAGDGLAACAWAATGAGHAGHSPAPPGALGAGETREGAAVNPFLADLKLVAPRQSARGLPRRTGAVPAERGTPPIGAGRTTPQLPWEPELPARPGACFLPPPPSLPPTSCSFCSSVVLRQCASRPWSLGKGAGVSEAGACVTQASAGSLGRNRPCSPIPAHVTHPSRLSPSVSQAPGEGAPGSETPSRPWGLRTKF